MRFLALFFLGLLATPLSACGPACDSQNICAVNGSDSPNVCDGSDFITCDDGHRGKTIFCGSQPRKAVCGSGGWSFEYAPLPAP